MYTYLEVTYLEVSYTINARYNIDNIRQHWIYRCKIVSKIVANFGFKYYPFHSILPTRTLQFHQAY